MKRTFVLLALGILILAALAACNTPQPLPGGAYPDSDVDPGYDAGGRPWQQPSRWLPASSSRRRRLRKPPVRRSTQPTVRPATARTARVRWTRPATSPMWTTCVRPRRSTSSRPSAAGGTRCRPSRTPCPTRNAGTWSITCGISRCAAEQLAKGKPVFETNCVACHGPDGQGAIPQAAKFSPEFVSKFPTTQFYQSVSGGKGIMPAWQDRLSSDDRWAAIEYARAFGYQPLNK